MKHFKLTKEEEKILKDFEDGKYVRVKNFEQEKKRLQEIARNTLNKTRNINIRLSEKDLHKIKVKAAEDVFLIRLLLVLFFTGLPIRKVLICKPIKIDLPDYCVMVLGAILLVL